MVVLLIFSHLCAFPTLLCHPCNSSALSSCHNRVYQSLANLIRWADQVMLDGIDLEDKENVASVTSVIKAVLDGVKVGENKCWLFFFYISTSVVLLQLRVLLCKQELVRLTIEKQEQPSPTTPNKPASPASAAAERWVWHMLSRMQETYSFRPLQHIIHWDTFIPMTACHWRCPW